ncbi:DNA adenine methylase [Pelotomaculum sp. FP]|uniref:Dam family site-specific DNA-(adenine-N6)-methyltransferase n=1 Tax=Pelotomaculum sp. FP TaxID=261474 RepID=UPI001066A7CB|nr:Dam family site-specific DNA-(adenine-N6)-methyltransferase [Pelotomaculum sp. FP]TEB15265.1 DNA adenine methylase [Pelotomaculum sp. FP]
MLKIRPFLKWAGNKYHILEQIKVVLPKGNRLIEPFVGSGAVFLNLAYQEYLLADNNGDLINLYLTLQAEGESFINYCKSFFTEENNRKNRYYELRELFNTTNENTLKAALFIYLNRHGYNGLCRYNSKGGFNTPFGQYIKPKFPEKAMQHFLAKAKNAVFKIADFRDIMKTAKKGDVVYCDPPYEPLSATANFTAYSSGGFGSKEQVELAEFARDLAGRGIPVLVSNHATEFILNAYKTARIERLYVQRFISCDGANRGKAEEVLALFGGA